MAAKTGRILACLGPEEFLIDRQGWEIAELTLIPDEPSWTRLNTEQHSVSRGAVAVKTGRLHPLSHKRTSHSTRDANT